jgi:hypothetical protein
MLVRSACGIQRLLSSAAWDADAVLGDVPDWVLSYLGDPDEPPDRHRDRRPSGHRPRGSPAETVLAARLSAERGSKGERW